VITKSNYSALIFWVLVNLLIWSWTSGFFQSSVLKTKQMGQSVRALEEIEAETVTVIKSDQKGDVDRIHPPEE